jgi:5S rRNA maturation endonuclease (ribonuclease M5)
LKVEIKELYQKLTGNTCPDGQSMVPSIWKDDKTPSLSINTDKNIFFDHATGIKGNAFNMVLGKSSLTKQEFLAGKSKLESMFGMNDASQYISKKPKETKIQPYDESESWNFIFVWHEFKQAMIDNFEGNKKILATLHSYFGQDYKLDYEFIEDMAMNYNVGWCPTHECLAIPYFSNDKVTYIDLMKWGGDNFKEKKIYAYPSKEHVHLNAKNDGFENAMELKKLSKCRLASNLKNIGRKDSLKRKPDEPLLICEGFKDALIATYFGLNAISTAGGAKSLGTFENELIIEKLKKRSSIGICFDNDDPGRTGAKELKALLENKGISNVNIVDLSDVCSLKGEDLADYFLKYKGDSKTLIQRARGANV